MVVFPCLFISHLETFVQLFVLFPSGASISVASPLVALAFRLPHRDSLDALPIDRPFREQIPVTESGWYSLYAEGPKNKFIDAGFAQATTNMIRVYVGDGKIRNRASAEYFIRWIDKLHTMAGAWPWWRSDLEKQHVLAQFEEAQKIYERLAAEAR